MAVYTDAIQKLYVAYFNRPADYEGLAFWEKVLTANGGDISIVSRAHAASPEYQEQVAGKTNFQIVNQIYNNLFNRDADVEGLQFWADRLTEGTFTVDQIVKVIAENASDTDAKDATTYKNKVAAATAFTAELDNASEIIGYTGDKANAAAKTWLSTIGTDASLKAAIDPAALGASVATVIQASIPQTQFSLTEGVDTYTGTFGNDVVTAAAGEKSTLNAGDVIDGNAGNDTLNIEVGAGINSDLSKVTIKNFETVNITGSDNLGLSAADAGKLAAVASAKAAADASAATLAAASTTATTLQGRLATAKADADAAQTAADDAQTAVDNADGAVTIAQNAVTTRQGELATANQVKAAAAYVASLTDQAGFDAAANAVDADVSPNAGYSAAQLRAAAAAAMQDADGVAYVDVADMIVRADELATSTAGAAATAQGNVTTAEGNLATAEGNLTTAQGDLATATADLATADAIEAAAQAAYDAAQTQVAAAATADVAAQTALSNAEAAAAGVAANATVNAAAFAGATAISLDGIKTTVTGLNSHTVTLNAEANVNNTLKYASAATSAKIVLDGTGGAIALADNSVTTETKGLATVNLSGSSYIAEGAESGLVSLSDATNAGAGAVKTLNVSLSNNTGIDISGLAKLTTVDASASTGGIGLVSGFPAKHAVSSESSISVALTSSTLTSVTTGSGDDTVVVVVQTAAAAGTTAAKNLTISTGAGDDKVGVMNLEGSTGLTTIDAGAGDDEISVVKVSGAGLNINGGAGNDVITLSGDALATTDVIDGGEGTDTVAMAGSTESRTADDFIVFNKLVKNFETIKFTTAEGYAAVGTTPAVALDASKLGANYTTIDLASDSFVANVGTQAIVANGNVDVTATGYKAATATAAATYAGTLNVTETVDGGHVVARADTVNLTVTASEDAAELHTELNALTVDAHLEGDVKTAVVTLANAVTEATKTVDAQDVFATVSIDTNAGNLASLASLTLKGTGGASIVNGDETALVNVDASGLSNALTQGDDAGDAVTSLVYTSFNSKAETIKLGAGLDTVILGASTYGAVDTVTGLNLVLAEDGESIDAAASDLLFINGVSAAPVIVTKMTTTQTDLDLALKDASVLKYTPTGSTTATDADLVIFAMGGDTYVYNDTNMSNSVDATDIVVKLTGTIDLDALALMLKTDAPLFN
ncbi:MAG: DUF4214 domain-containing protein [Janthinobacterium lividum]